MTNATMKKCFAGLGIALALNLTGSVGAIPSVRDENRLYNDPWGIHLKGELVTPQRDESDEYQIQFGWPRRMVTDAPMWGRSPTIVDVDRNGDWEVAIVNGTGRLFIYQHDGALFPGFPTQSYRGNRPEPWEDPTFRSITSIGDVDRDGSPDIVYPTDIAHLHVVGRNLNEPNPYPIDLTRGTKASAVISIDLNNDQSSELVFTTYSARPLGQNEALLHVLDASGNELNGWPVRCGIGTGSSPAVGDIDGDNGFEIAVASGRNGETPGRIWAFELDGSRVNGFPQGSYESIDGSVILANWDGNAGSEIIFSATPLDVAQSSLYALNSRGAILPGFPRNIGNNHPFGNPVVGGEVVDNKYTEIYFGEFNPAGHAHIDGFRRDEGGDSLLQLISIDIGVGVVGSIVTADILGGDLHPEIVAALAPTEDHEGRIIIANQNEIRYIDLADYGGGAFSSSPTLWDLDRDGHTEIIAVTTDGRVYIWHTEGFFAGEIWPTERGDFERSGRKMPYQALDVNEPENEALSPGQFIIDAYPNPFNSRLAVNVASPINGKLEVGLFDLKGSEVSSYSSSIKVGEVKNFTFDAGNLGISSGVYIMKWSVGKGFEGSRSVLFLP